MKLVLMSLLLSLSVACIDTGKTVVKKEDSFKSEKTDTEDTTTLSVGVDESQQESELSASIESEEMDVEGREQKDVSNTEGLQSESIDRPDMGIGGHDATHGHSESHSTGVSETVALNESFGPVTHGGEVFRSRARLIKDFVEGRTTMESESLKASAMQFWSLIEYFYRTMDLELYRDLQPVFSRIFPEEPYNYGPFEDGEQNIYSEIQNLNIDVKTYPPRHWKGSKEKYEELFGNCYFNDHIHSGSKSSKETVTSSTQAKPFGKICLDAKRLVENDASDLEILSLITGHEVLHHFGFLEEEGYVSRMQDFLSANHLNLIRAFNNSSNPGFSAESLVLKASEPKIITIKASSSFIINIDFDPYQTEMFLDEIKSNGKVEWNFTLLSSTVDFFDYNSNSLLTALGIPKISLTEKTEDKDKYSFNLWDIIPREIGYHRMSYHEPMYGSSWNIEIDNEKLVFDEEVNLSNGQRIIFKVVE
ncbi:MAG: hypothetical protein AB8E15_05185 [Bdellovibrionales bacterium]